MKRLFIFVLSLFSAVAAFSQSRALVDSLVTEVHFRWDKSNLDTLYMGNNHTLRSIRQKIDSISLEKIDSVVIVSQSSPEGAYLHNQKLSARRAATMRKYMEENYPELNSRLRVNPDGESWGQLREWVVRDTLCKETSLKRVLRIIDDNSVSIDTKKWRMEKDPIYRYLYKTYYPRIRNSMILMLYTRIEPEELLLSEHIALKPSKVATPVIEHIEPIIIPQKDTLTFALKTNMLYDLATALNVEVEVPIGRHFSVAAEYVFPWWERGNKYCFQMLEAGVEARYWFRDNTFHAQKLKGHFVGVYGMTSMFDFQWNKKLCYQGEYWSAGLTYGYSLPISPHLNMEFSLSVGYLSSAYRHYYPATDYSELWRDKYKVGRIGYFGPTKAKISLVVPINIPYSKRGGGR